MDPDSGRPKGQGSSAGVHTPALEWIAAGIGLLLTLALLVVIGREALEGERGEVPVVEVEVERVVEKDGLFIVEVSAVNRSGATAAAVEIEGSLATGTGETTSSATIDYVPGHSRRRAGLFFRDDPRRGRLEVRAIGYEEV